MLLNKFGRYRDGTNTSSRKGTTRNSYAFEPAQFFVKNRFEQFVTWPLALESMIQGTSVFCLV